MSVIGRTRDHGFSVMRGADVLPIGPTQRLVLFMDRVAPVNFVVAAEVEGRLDAAAVARGAAAVRDAHPLARARVLTRGGGLAPEFLFEDTDLPVPVTALDPPAFAGDGLRLAIEAELARPFEADRGPLARLAVASESPGRHRVLLTLHHAIADGASGAIALRDFLTAAGAPGSAAPRARLADLRTTGPEFDGISAVRRAADLARFFLRVAPHFLRAPAGRTVAHPNAPASGRTSAVLLARYDAGQTAALLAHARAAGATAGGLVSAALLRAVHGVSGAPRRARHLLINAADVRPFVPEDRRGRVDLLMSFVATTHRADAPLAELSRECAAAVREAVSRRDAVVPHTLAGLLPSLDPGRGAAAAVRVADRFATSAAVTNVGRVELPSDYGALRLADVLFAPSLGFMGRFAAVASTFDGRLTLNFSYVRQVVGSALAREIAGGALAELRPAVGGGLPAS